MRINPSKALVPTYRVTGAFNPVTRDNTPANVKEFTTVVKDANGIIVDTVTYRRRTGYGRDAERGEYRINIEHGCIAKPVSSKPRLTARSTGHRN